MAILGVDTGGTFTDFVLWQHGRLRLHKVLSTPHAPEQAILQGIRELGLQPEGLRLVHGSTVATNAALEGKGVRTLFITNLGFADLLTIGRQNRRELYNLQPKPVLPPVPPELCLEADCRLDARGVEIRALSQESLNGLAEAVAKLKPKAVAICLLFSWLDAKQEQAIAKSLPADLFLSLSSEVLPEIREYERGMATWLNAWIGPLVQDYLSSLQQGLPGTRLSVMQSSGDTLDAAAAGRQAVRMLLSGPAGGLVAASWIGAQCGQGKLLTFDMGGTSTDVALINGRPRLTSEGRIANYPVALPMVDMHTIGAGGGSIAWLDEGGMLQVGPQSAGADPGPVCYGRGGSQPTVTDANLVLGRIDANSFLGGAMQLDVAAAWQALADLACRIGCSTEQAAQGILDIANEHMVRALRVISVQRGEDPQHCLLLSFGGAGGLHVCALAEALGVDEALVPAHAGVLSALGMLLAKPGRQLSRTWQRPLTEVSDAEVQGQFAALLLQGQTELAQEGLSADELEAGYSLDLRYVGQSSQLNLAWTSVAEVQQEFHQAHQARYGHRLPLPVELVNLRLSLNAIQGLSIDLDAPPAQGTDAKRHESGVLHLWRRDLALGQVIEGPAVISEPVATTWLAPGWLARLDGLGNLRLSRISC